VSPARAARPVKDPRLLGIAEAVRRQMGGDLTMRRQVYRYLVKAPDLSYKEMLEIVMRWEFLGGIKPY
jgi:hypothetical protein